MKKKVFKIVLCIILAIICLGLISFIYKFVWYSKILKAKDNLILSNNFSFVMTSAGFSRNPETREYTLQYSSTGKKVKDGKIVTIGYEDFNKDKEIISKNFYIKDNETINVNLKEKTFSLGTSQMIGYFNNDEIDNYPILPIFIYFKDDRFKGYTFGNKVYCTFKQLQGINNTKIKFVDEDGKKYVVLQTENDKNYFDKETLLPAKVVTKEQVFSEEEYVQFYFEFESGNVKDEDVTIPDLSDYTQSVNGF